MAKIEMIKSLVRPIISVSVVLTVVYLSIIGRIDAKDMLEVGSIIIAFHFGERASKVNNNGRN